MTLDNEMRKQMINSIKNEHCVDGIVNILDGYTLKPFQTIGATFAFLNKKAMIADEMGLGKTLQACAYLRLLQTFGELKKVLVVTKSKILPQFAIEVYNSTGLRLMPLFGDARQQKIQIQNQNFMEYDGIITTQSSINMGVEFSRYFLTIVSYFNTIIFDESQILSHKNNMFNICKYMFQRFENILLLNGNPFKRNLYELNNQIFFIDKSKHLSDYALEQKYAHVEVDGRYKKNVTWINPKAYYETIQDKVISRTRKDIGIEDIRDFQLVPVKINDWQLRTMSLSNYSEVLTCPVLVKNDYIMNRNSVPALNSLIECVEDCIEYSKIVVYAYNIDIKPVIKDEIEKNIQGANCCIIDGTMNSYEAEKNRVDFENGKYNICITNIQEGLNLGSANVFIAYDIPTDTEQALSRIIRNAEKSYNIFQFLVHLNTPQVKQLSDILLKAEQASNETLNRDVKTFKSLNKELKNIENFYI